jgi:tRNA pseudouridine55 synthase
MDGFLLCDKPAGRTSHDVVAAVRRALGGGRKGPRVGHAGTLDPFATGLLVVLIGRATRVQRYVMALPKSYETVARFGATSSTGDTEGEITETGVIPEGDLDLPTGAVRQRPPAYSAIKVAGRRAYELARAGEEVELPERTVTVHRFDELWRDGSRRAFAIECSSGTYVRSLVADLGDAYCEELRRTAIGPFRVEDAGAPDELDRVVPLGDALGAFLPRVELDADAARAAGHGREIDAPAGAPVPGRAPGGAAPGSEGVVLLSDDAGPIAVAEPREAGRLRAVVGFRG